MQQLREFGWHLNSDVYWLNELCVTSHRAQSVVYPKCPQINKNKHGTTTENENRSGYEHEFLWTVLSVKKNVAPKTAAAEQ